MSMSLYEWIKSENLSYQAAAIRLKLSTATIVRRYALGLCRPPAPERMQQIFERTDRKVTPGDWYPGIAVPSQDRAGLSQALRALAAEMERVAETAIEDRERKEAELHG